MMDDEKFRDFIQSQADDLVQDGVIGTAIVLFEFISKEGKQGYSILRPFETTWLQAGDLLHDATMTLVPAIDDMYKDFPDEDITDIDN